MVGNITFESICVDFSYADNIIIELKDDSTHLYDCFDTCLIWNRMTFYGIPFGLSGDQINDIYERKYDDVIKIGELFGCLILSKQIIEEGEDPLEACDAEHEILEYIYSALSDEEGPLNEETGDPEQNVYYLHKLRMVPEYDSRLIKSRILDELPKLVFNFIHVFPDIIAYYPAPLNYTPDPVETERYMILQKIAAQKLDSAFSAIMGRKPANQEDNVVSFANAYRFTEDELKLVMRRRYSGSSYPEEAKNSEEFSFYMSHGFVEVGNSRVLYKYVVRL